MATFADILQGLNTRLTTGMNQPLTQLGLQMLAQSGPQANNPGFGARLGQAGMGFAQQQGQMQELQQQQMLRQIQQQQIAAAAAKQESENRARSRVQSMIQSDPNILANNPLARAVLESTGDYSAIGDLAKLGPQTPAAPRMPWQFEQKLPTGEAVQHIYDPAAGGYQAGQPFRPTAQQNVDIRGAQLGLGQQRWESEQQFKESQAAERASQFQQTLGQR